MKKSPGAESVALLRVGQKASLRKSFSAQEVEQFGNISLDRNPLHLDEEYAAKTPFGSRIVHGMLVASLFSGLLGQKLPGEGTIFLGANLQFKKPVYIDDKVTASVEITKIREDKPIVTLRMWCENESGDTVVEGEAVVKAPAVQS